LHKGRELFDRFRSCQMIKEHPYHGITNFITLLIHYVTKTNPNTKDFASPINVGGGDFIINTKI